MGPKYLSRVRAGHAPYRKETVLRYMASSVFGKYTVDVQNKHVWE